ncbi:MAG TPA: exodeoxyribonuclease VII large subunit, partial [Gammaproteobacteria bacterium]
ALRVLAPKQRLSALGERHRWATQSMERAIRACVKALETRREIATRALNAVSPLATLDRGYAIVTNAADGSIVTSADDAQPGSGIDVRLARGALSATVDSVRNSEDD